jgi:hypothetical protein
MFSQKVINDLRYGYIRQGYGSRGPGAGVYTDLLDIDPLTAENRSTIYSVPVNNIVDNLSWTKGKHTLQFGGNWRLVHQNRGTNENSFNSANSNPSWLGGNPPAPTEIGAAPVDTGFGKSYIEAYGNLIGTVPQATEVQNYAVFSATSGTLLGQGAFLNRDFKANEYEWYVQDAWRVSPRLILTVGLRHTILQTPWEVHGQQVAPTVDTDAWYKQREIAALQGQVFEQELTFAPNGPFYHKPGYWPKQKKNFAPRLAVAYSPDTRTSIRAGFGLFFDHYGESLVNTFSQQGSFGLSSQITSPPGVYGYEGDATYLPSPRYINRTTFPNIPLPPAPATTTFPYTYPPGNFGTEWGINSRIQTPYSESFDFSIQRQVSAGFTLEANYLGRLGRHLLQSLDLAEPVDYVDPLGAGDYFTAASRLSREVDENGGVYPAPAAAIQYFEDVFPFMANHDYQGESATQAIYNNEWARFRSNLGETSALADLDFFCSYGCPLGTRFWVDQFSSLYALSSIGMSYYNAGQLVLRHPTTSGLTLDFSYTFSNSIDMGSDVERGTETNGGGGNLSTIINTWKPYLNRGPSDFDTRHLITADWIYQLPFGSGRRFFPSANAVTEAFIGGWQWSGISRWTSGLPFRVISPGWGTDWNFSSFGVVTGRVQIHKHIVNGAPQVFADPNAINSGTATGSPIRLAYPGETGERNNFRADGIFGIDSGLAKTWKIKEQGTVRFSWEVFNLTNSVRFNCNGSFMGRVLTEGNLGVYRAMQNLPRRMQFGLRYDF